jgi:hypothetical protein
MERFTDAELLAIILAIEMARRLVHQSGRVEPPEMFDAIEAKIRPALQVDDETLDRLLAEAIGEVRWIN